MYRLKEIQDALLHVVGWEQSFDPAKAINDDLTQTESGLYFQGAHPLVTLDNIRAIVPDDFVYQYPEWNLITEYKTGAKVRHNNEIWIARKDNQNEEPTKSDFNADFNYDFGNEYWGVYNFLSDYLERLTRNGIAQMVQTFTQVKGLDKETKNLLERRTFFDGAGRIRATLQNTHKLVGFEIVPVRSMGVTMKIEQIGLQMTGATGTVRMYLFHSSQIDPIKTFDLNFTVTNGGFQWFPLKDCYLPYISDTTNAGGSWYLCYNQDELPAGMEAINMVKDWSREPCGTCTGYGLDNWKEITKYLQVTPFMFNAPETFAEYPELWDVALTMYTTTQNYGLNCEITVGCDLTDFIIKERQIFQTVIQRQVAATALRTLAMNPDVKVNRNQVNATRLEILYELDGNTTGVRPGGLGYDLKKAYEALRLDTQGIDRICLTCNNYGVKYRTT
jgi:hypothetical protein|nr:MAG TPA: hypothetical protein [Caudoviricetes sp.]